MSKLVKSLSICVITFILAISNFGCSARNNNKTTIEVEKKVHEVTYTYVDCGDLKLKGIGIKLENPDSHAGSYENQQINTRNLILLDYKLKEAETILECYKRQAKKSN